MRKKVFIGLSSAIVLAFAVYPYFDRKEPIRLAKQTTHLVSPLAEDGLPNYSLAILEHERAGVTPENNAAPLFWQAMGPGEARSRGIRRRVR